MNIHEHPMNQRMKQRRRKKRKKENGMLLSIGYMTVWLLWYILMNWNFGNIFLPFHFTFFYPHLPSPHLLHMSVCLSVSVIIRFYVFIIELLFCCFALVVLFVSSYFTLFHSIHFSLFLFWFRLFFFRGGECWYFVGPVGIISGFIGLVSSSFRFTSG